MSLAVHGMQLKIDENGAVIALEYFDSDTGMLGMIQAKLTDEELADVEDNALPTLNRLLVKKLRPQDADGFHPSVPDIEVLNSETGE